MKEYALREIWGSQGAPVLDTRKARSAAAAIVAYLRSQGYSARVTADGMVTDAEAPSLRADRVSR